MKTGVVIFPGSNCDRDAMEAAKSVFGKPAVPLWHRDTTIPALDLIILPGGFSFGDYLRCGAMAAQAPVMTEIRAAAARGVPVLGICNGFQILVEARMLPGVLLRNTSLRFVAKDQVVEVVTTNSPFTRAYAKGTHINLPIAHGEGNYSIDADGLKELEDHDQIAFRYPAGENPNGAISNIAGIISRERTICGLMPHPERASNPVIGKIDGILLFESLLEGMA
jgi:phosphoribosylformylglycinamidine synthase I